MTAQYRSLLPFVAILFVIFSAGCARRPMPAPAASSAPSGATAAARAAASGVISRKSYAKPSDAELHQRLTALEYEVTQNAATEPPFQNKYWDNHEDGLYVDVATGEPLFSSRDKFNSGTGWPSFTQPVEPNRVTSATDDTLGMARTEVRSRVGNSHLGHVFDDGPAPGGLRYCINSAALRFIPVSELAQAGYGDYAILFDKNAAPSAAASGSSNADVPEPNTCTKPAPGEKAGCAATLETAVLAGGCFWGMEEILRKIPGVLTTEVGYTGGKAGVKYEDVHTGETGNAEAVRIVFDPAKLSYEDLLAKWFFRMHDPTTKDRQGNDIGSQYRSAIFVTSPAQREIAERVKKRVDVSGVWHAPVVTQIVDAGPFTLAEDSHQHYLEKNPGGYTCHYLRDFSKPI